MQLQEISKLRSKLDLEYAIRRTNNKRTALEMYLKDDGGAESPQRLDSMPAKRLCWPQYPERPGTIVCMMVDEALQPISGDALDISTWVRPLSAYPASEIKLEAYVKAITKGLHHRM